MSRKGENIYKRKDGRWEGRYIKERINGKLKYGYVFAYSYKEVKEKLNLAKLSLNDTLEPSDSIINIEIEKFSSIAKEWIKISGNQWKKSTVAKYKNIVTKYLLPQFGDYKITEIKRENIQEFVLDLLASGNESTKSLAPKTINCIISVMKNIFDYATMNKGYTLITFDGLYVKQTQKKMRIFTLTEQEILTKYLLSNLNLTSLGILICLYTGIRIGELCALKWKDISFQEKYIHIQSTMQRLPTKGNANVKTEVIITSPKSICSNRVVPIPNELVSLLQKNKDADDSYILTGEAHSFIEPRTMQNRFKSIIRKCGVTDANFHALRHTFATRCIELGFDVKSLSEILGHSSINITLNRYVHPSLDLKTKNMNLLSKLLTVK